MDASSSPSGDALQVHACRVVCAVCAVSMTFYVWFCQSSTRVLENLTHSHELGDVIGDGVGDTLMQLDPNVWHERVSKVFTAQKSLPTCRLYTTDLVRLCEPTRKGLTLVEAEPTPPPRRSAACRPMKSISCSSSPVSREPFESVSMSLMKFRMNSCDTETTLDDCRLADFP